MDHPQSPSVDVFLLIALREEREALPSFFTRKWKPDEHRGHRYYRFEFRDQHNISRTGIATYGYPMEMGPSGAQFKASIFIERFRPALVVNIGIAGILSGDVSLGDIIIADSAELYLHRSKAAPDTSGSHERGSLAQLKLGGRSHSTTNEIVQKFVHFADAHRDVHAAWLQRLHQLDTERDEGQAAAWKRPRNTLKILAGPLATGDTVVADSSFKQWLKDHHRNYLAVEMEAAAILAAVHAQPHDEKPRTLIIKTASDGADEKKSDVEKLGGDGAFRRWSMENACALLEVALTQMDLLPRGDGAARQPSPEQFRQQVEEMTEKLFLGPPFNAATPPSAEQLQHHSALLELSAQLDSRLAAQEGTLLHRAARRVLAPSNGSILTVNGPHGTGKSTFLNLLYWHLRHGQHEGVLPVYIDTACYDRRIYEDVPPARDSYKVQAINAFRDEIQPLIDFLDAQPAQRVVVLVDNLDDHGFFREAILGELLKVLGKAPRRDHVAVISTRTVGNRTFELTRQGVSTLLSLQAIPCNSERLEPFIRRFVQTQGGQADDIVKYVKERIERFRLDELDLRLLQLLVSKRGVGTYDEATSIGQFYRHICYEHLTTPNSGKALAEAAELAYRCFIRHEDIPKNRLAKTPAWAFINSHPYTCDYLIAQHVVGDILELANPTMDFLTNSAEEIVALDYIYPWRYMRFFRGILENSPIDELRLLDATARAFGSQRRQMQITLSYLLGRLQGKSTREEAIKLLKEQKEVILSQQMNLSEFSNETLLLLRTMNISLITLGDTRALTEYISKLLTDRRWDRLNRGFHLRYYGDIEYEPERLLVTFDDDESKPFKKTARVLAQSLERNLHNKDYHRFEVELLTLCSLAQHRHIRQCLGEEERALTLDIVSQVLGSRRHIHNKLREYLETVSATLKRRNFTPGAVLHDLSRLKEKPCAEWLGHDLGAARVESLSERLMGACLIGLLYLPDATPDGRECELDKEQVLQLLLIHGLTQAFPVEPASDEKGSRREEQAGRWASYLRFLTTYDGIHGLSRADTLWHELKTQNSAEANVARDIEQLAALAQLHAYRQRLSPSDFKELHDELVSRITTTEGDRIRAIIERHFELECEQPEVKPRA